MGVIRIVAWKTLRTTVPWAMVVVPVFVLFGSFLTLVAQFSPAVVIDLFGVIVGTIVFSAGLIYMCVKHEKAIQNED